jgi:hypothetical protein
VTAAKYIADVSADVFARVARFAANRDVRRTLNGVRIIASGGGRPVTLLSSNGVLLYAEEDPIGTASQSVTVQVPRLAVARKLDDAHRVRVTADGTLSIFSLAKRDGGCLYVHPVPAFIDGTFPDFLPSIGNAADYDEGLRGDFDVSLLLRAAELTKGFGQPIRFYTAKPPAQRIAFVIGGGRTGANRGKAFGMVMPLKSTLLAGLEANMPEALRPSSPTSIVRRVAA